MDSVLNATDLELAREKRKIREKTHIKIKDIVMNVVFTCILFLVAFNSSSLTFTYKTNLDKMFNPYSQFDNVRIHFHFILHYIFIRLSGYYT